MQKSESAVVSIAAVSGSQPGVQVVKIDGPLLITNFFEFQDLIRRNETPVLIVDFANVPYLDSAALGSIVGLHVSCGRSQRKYAIVNVNPRIQTMLQVSGVKDVVTMFPTVEDAEKALAANS